MPHPSDSDLLASSSSLLAPDSVATRYPLPATTSAPLAPFLAELLADQQKLQTPVTRAATAHDLQPSAWRAERFRELIPLTAPAPGQHYAFEVDLDSCSGCKACVSGCHSLNGLDEEETWRDVGVVYGLSALAAPNSAPSSISHRTSSIIHQTVTTACHHCADPACLNGCPVLAYEKDPVTGIVRHLDDQCIGCSYCILKCPYDVPKFNERLGIVRKCDMCHGRLAAGEAPACAQACPTQAIKIVLVPAPGTATRATPSPAASSPPGNAELPLGRPSSPTASASVTITHPTSPILHSFDPILRLPADPAYTRPTTRYVTRRALPDQLRAADADTLRPQHAHLALVALLVGTQLALGLLLSASLVTRHSSLVTLSATCLFFAALAASVAHLGQPLRAWRIFLGLRRSWLSREAVVLGAAAPFVALTALLPWLPDLLDFVTRYSSLATFTAAASDLLELVTRHSSLVTQFAVAATAFGVFCSAMIYIDTRRHFWRPTNTFTRMGGTVVVAALAFVSAPAAAAALATKLLTESLLLRGSPVSARLHARSGPLRLHFLARLALGSAATVLFALSLPLPAFLLFALGELAERALYFRAVDAPKMPGQPAAGH